MGMSPPCPRARPRPCPAPGGRKAAGRRGRALFPGERRGSASVSRHRDRHRCPYRDRDLRGPLWGRAAAGLRSACAAPGERGRGRVGGHTGRMGG